MRELQDYLFEVILYGISDRSLALGNISIDITAQCVVALQEVLLLHDRAPDLQLSFTHPEKESSMMSILLDIDLWPKFHAYIAEKTIAVVLNIDHDDFLVFCPGPADEIDSDEELEPVTQWAYPYIQGCSLHVKEEYVETWMSESWHGTDRWREGKYKWEAALGLENRKKVRCLIAPHA